MTRTRKLTLGAALLLLASSLVWAQPGGRGAMPRRNDAGGHMGGGMMLSPEQALGILALDPELGVTDKQLLDLRAALREAYLDQQQLQADMRGGEMDFQAAREMMEGQREKVTTALSGVLTAEQLAAFQQHLENRRPMRGGGGNRRR